MESYELKRTYKIFKSGEFKDKDMSRAFNRAINPIAVSLLLEENEKLETAIRETIEDNLHLADGEVCTLIKLKRAINYT